MQNLVHAFFISNKIGNWLKLAKNYAKAKQHPEAELLTNMFRKKVCLFQCDYKINCTENENDNGKIHHINKRYTYT